MHRQQNQGPATCVGHDTFAGRGCGLLGEHHRATVRCSNVITVNCPLYLLLRYLHPPFDPNNQAGLPLPLPNHPYRSVGCIFNHKSFYANCQASDNVSTCTFDLENTSLWKPMSTEAIRSAPPPPTPPSSQPYVHRSVCRGVSPSPCPLLPPVGDPALAANAMEAQLRTLTFQHREVSHREGNVLSSTVTPSQGLGTCHSVG